MPAARWWLALAWLAVAVALWGLLGTPGWLVERRPRLVLEAFFAETATPAQVDEFSRTAQGQGWCCGIAWLAAEEARAEAGRDARVRSLLEAYGGNPFLRSYRLTICPEALEAHAAAAEWMKGLPGVASVRAPAALAARALEAEREVLAVARAAFGTLLAFGLLGGWFALLWLAAPLADELRVYAELGASPARVRMRALTALGGPALVLAAVVAILLELASVLARFSAGVAPGGAAALLPPFPHAAAPLICAAAAVAALVAALWTAGRRGLLRPR